MELADDNPYNTHDEKAATALGAYLENEKQVGEAFAQAFGKEAGAKRTVDSIVKSMKAAGADALIDEYKRHSIYVVDADRPGATGDDASGAGPDRDAVLAALDGQWKPIRFSAAGEDLSLIHI